MYRLNDELSEIVQRHRESLDCGIDQELALCRAQLERVLRDETNSSTALARTEKMLIALVKAEQLSRKLKIESHKLLPVEEVALILRVSITVLGGVIEQHADQEVYYQIVDDFGPALQKAFADHPTLKDFDKLLPEN